ncbi:hypothetical protein ACNQGP_08465 [Flavobacterium sp. GT2N3]|uniref:hypothetical protein n=1 Tax=unclassified Flavobacterium TaxID=196869 RepID=UPI003AAB8BCA
MLLQLDKDLIIESSDEDDIILFSSNIRGSITIFFVQYDGIISIIIELTTIENCNKKKEWIFLDNMNQHLIFNSIIKDLESFSNSSFDSYVLKKWFDKSNQIIQNTVLTNSNSIYNIPQSFFCVAFSEIEKLNKFQKISTKGYFEILFFNCLITVEKSDVKEQNQLWDQLVSLLVFYLKNHNLIKHVKDIEKLLEDRLVMYSEEIQLIKSNPYQNYTMLYHYFFLKPLKLPSKIKPKVKQNSNLSQTIQSAEFSKIVLLMIADIEEKLPILQNLIL